jgi:hypothetical protein
MKRMVILRVSLIVVIGSFILYMCKKENYEFSIIDKFIEDYNNYKLYCVVYFHPECEICHSSLKQIKDCSNEVKFILITNCSEIETYKYLMDNNLSNSVNISIIIDNDLKIYDKLQIMNIPTFFIYNSKKSLLLRRIGYINTKVIIEKYLFANSKL